MSVPSPEHQDDPVTAVLRGLAVSALRTNLGRAAVIAEALQAAESGQLVRGQRLAAATAAHQVVGSAGTFGLPEASRAAARLEELFDGPTEGADRADGPATPVWGGASGPAAADLREARRQLDVLTTLLQAETAAHQREE